PLVPASRQGPLWQRRFVRPSTHSYRRAARGTPAPRSPRRALRPTSRARKRRARRLRTGYDGSCRRHSATKSALRSNRAGWTAAVKKLRPSGFDEDEAGVALLLGLTRQLGAALRALQRLAVGRQGDVVAVGLPRAFLRLGLAGLAGLEALHAGGHLQ